MCIICVNILYEFAHKEKKRCQMWKEESQTEIMWKTKKKKLTTPAVPRWSPIQVLSRPDTA